MGHSIQSQTISVDGYCYHCLTCGNGQRPPMLFLHGFLGCGADFARVMESLSDGFNCVAVDLPGHGLTQVHEPETGYRMEAIAPSLVALLNALNIQACHLLGYSMGGRLALYLVLQYPDLFQTLILESSSPGLKTEQERRDRRQQDECLAQRLEQEDFAAFLSAWYQLPLFQSLNQHPSYGTMLQRRLRNDPLELGRSLRGMGTGMQPSLWESLPQLTLPTLLLSGEYDAKFIQIAQHMQAIHPAIAHEIIPQVGHTLHLENEWAFIQAIQSFLDQ